MGEGRQAGRHQGGVSESSIATTHPFALGLAAAIQAVLSLNYPSGVRGMRRQDADVRDNPPLKSGEVVKFSV
jgi:hypothetical protein